MKRKKNEEMFSNYILILNPTKVDKRRRR